MSTSSKSTFRSAFETTRTSVHKRRAHYLARRPHRSFQLTRRRDVHRSLELPSFIRFTGEVQSVVWTFRRPLLLAAAVYLVLTTIFIGIGSQETYRILLETMRETSDGAFESGWGVIGGAGLLFVSLATTGLSGTLTEAQQIYLGIMVLIMWLSIVWLLRNLLAGHKVKVRDAFYNSGAPIVPTALIAVLLIVQLVPLALAFFGYGAAVQSGLLAGGVEAMLFWIAAGLLVILSLYWVTSTFFAMIIATLPGMYPWRAIRMAGDMVVGRRVRILLRLLWMAAVIIVAWALVLIPIILIDSWLKDTVGIVEWLPIVPVVLAALGAVTIVWSTTYIYLLYRKVVDDDARPA